MEQEGFYNWFLIMCSWDPDADKQAIDRFQWVYNYYLNVYDARLKEIPDEDPRKDLDFYNLIALNLIGQRKFVIIGRTKSNRVLQEISSNVTLETSIRVDVFPATYVHDFARLNYQRLGIKKETIPDRSKPPEPRK